MLEDRSETLPTREPAAKLPFVPHSLHFHLWTLINTMASTQVRTCCNLLLFSACMLFVPTPLTGQDAHAAEVTMIQDGRLAYTSNCSGCHGADGSGTEHAPRLANNPDLRGRPIDRLHSTIAAGFPASGMPPFAGLPAHDLDAPCTRLTLQRRMRPWPAMPRWERSSSGERVSAEPVIWFMAWDHRSVLTCRMQGAE